MSQWHIDQNGKQLGPFTSSQIRKLATQGRITRDTLLRRDRDAEWFQASRIQNLFAEHQPAHEPSDDVPNHDVTFSEYRYADQVASLDERELNPFSSIDRQPNLESLVPTVINSNSNQITTFKRQEIRSFFNLKTIGLIVAVAGITAVAAIGGMLLGLRGSTNQVVTEAQPTPDPVTLERSDVSRLLRKATVITANSLTSSEQTDVAFQEAINQLQSDISSLESCVRDLQILHRVSTLDEQDATIEYLKNCQSLLRMTLSLVRNKFERKSTRFVTEYTYKQYKSGTLPLDEHPKPGERLVGFDEGLKLIEQANELISRRRALADTQQQIARKLQSVFEMGDILTDEQLTLPTK